MVRKGGGWGGETDRQAGRPANTNKERTNTRTHVGEHIEMIPDISVRTYMEK
jgi:hypothetical protein